MSNVGWSINYLNLESQIKFRHFTNDGQIIYTSPHKVAEIIRELLERKHTDYCGCNEEDSFFKCQQFKVTEDIIDSDFITCYDSRWIFWNDMGAAGMWVARHSIDITECLSIH